MVTGLAATPGLGLGSNFGGLGLSTGGGGLAAGAGAVVDDADDVDEVLSLGTAEGLGGEGLSGAVWFSSFFTSDGLGTKG